MNTGKVIPVTLDNVVLKAKLNNGVVVQGESNIPEAVIQYESPIDRLFIVPEDAKALKEAVDAIMDADAIILGPGSLYTSVIPNILIKDIGSALAKTKALTIYVSNIMTQPGETDAYSVSDHVRTLASHSHSRILDYCLVNTGEIPHEILQRYALQNSYLVVNDRKKIEQLGYRVIEDDFGIVENGVIRHNPQKLASIIFGFMEEI